MCYAIDSRPHRWQTIAAEMIEVLPDFVEGPGQAYHAASLDALIRVLLHTQEDEATTCVRDGDDVLAGQSSCISLKLEIQTLPFPAPSVYLAR